MDEKIAKIEVDLALIGQAMENNNKSISDLTIELGKLASNLPDVIYTINKVNKIEATVENLSEKVSQIDTRLSIFTQQVDLHSKLLYGTVSILLSSILIEVIGTVVTK